MTQTANKPVDDVRIGRVKATIWRNETEDGKPRYNVVFARLYKDGNRGQSAPELRRGITCCCSRRSRTSRTRGSANSPRSPTARTTARPSDRRGGRAAERLTASPLFCPPFPHPSQFAGISPATRPRFGLDENDNSIPVSRPRTPSVADAGVRNHISTSAGFSSTVSDHHAPEAASCQVGPLSMTAIEPVFQTALVPPVGGRRTSKLFF